MKKPTNGRKQNKGAEGRAGRKPVEDKKVSVSIYIKESEIEKLGGKDNVREIMLKAIEIGLSKK